MPKVILPDKPCSHCGGVEYYEEIRNNKTQVPTTRYHCVKKRKEVAQIYRDTPTGYATNIEGYNTRIAHLTDSYMKQYIYKYILQSSGVRINKEEITQEQIQEYRQSLLAFRQIKQFKNGKPSNIETSQGGELRIKEPDRCNIYKFWYSNTT